ncbi:MAG: hypothetical protein ACE5R5_04855, partial [Nitrosarchaeum sp.]
GGNFTTEPITVAAKFSNISSKIQPIYQLNKTETLSNSIANVTISSNELVENTTQITTQDNATQITTQDNATQIKKQDNSFNFGLIIGIGVGIAIGVVLFLILRQKPVK